MASVTAPKKSTRAVKPRLAGREIHERLEQIELATVSSLRALQMDIEGDAGVSSATVLKKARAALR